MASVKFEGLRKFAYIAELNYTPLTLELKIFTLSFKTRKCISNLGLDSLAVGTVKFEGLRKFKYIAELKIYTFNIGTQNMQLKLHNLKVHIKPRVRWFYIAYQTSVRWVSMIICLN